MFYQKLNVFVNEGVILEANVLGLVYSLRSDNSSLTSADHFSVGQHDGAAQSKYNSSEDTNTLYVKTGVDLTIYSACVDVQMDSNMRKGIYRSTKKNAQETLRYNLIYVGAVSISNDSVILDTDVNAMYLQTSKDAYDCSQEEENQLYTTESVFQGLRANFER